MKYTFFETESGKKIKTAQFNGYSIAERLLEDLMFQVTIQDDGTIKVWVKPEDDGYFQQFNTQKFLKEAKEYAEENDIFEDPISGEDCWFVRVEEEEKKPPMPKKLDAKRAATMPGIPKEIQDIIQKAGSVYGVGSGGGRMTVGIDDDGEFVVDTDLQEIKTEEKPKVLGKYTTKSTKFHDFIATIGNVNVLSKEATIDGKYFDSLNLEGIKFKMTLRDDNTFDFEEILTNYCEEDDIKRYVLMLEESSVGGYRDRSVIVDFKFIATHVVKEKEVQMESFLVCEPRKPYNDLLDFLEEEESKPLSEDDYDEKMKMLFGEDFSLEDEPPTPEIQPEAELTYSQQMIAAEFLEAKKEKREQHLKKMENLLNERKVAQNNYNLAQMKINECDTEIELLNSRIDSLEINEPFNGYFFFIPEAISDKCILDEEIKQLIYTKVAATRSVNPDAFIKLFDNYIYRIRIGLISEGNMVELTDFKNILPIIKNYTNWEGKIYTEGEKLLFEGKVEWSHLNNKFIRNGFKNEHTFEEFCNKQDEPQPYPEDSQEDVEEETYSIEETIQDFEENIGYPIGDEFIFGILYNPDGTTEDICGDVKVCIAITPKSYFDNEGCCYDDHINDILNHKFPTLNETRYLEEVCESDFILSKDGNTTMDINEAIEYLATSGLKFSTKYQDFLSSKDTILVKYLIACFDPTIILD